MRMLDAIASIKRSQNESPYETAAAFLAARLMQKWAPWTDVEYQVKAASYLGRFIEAMRAGRIRPENVVYVLQLFAYLRGASSKDAEDWAVRVCDWAEERQLWSVDCSRIDGRDLMEILPELFGKITPIWPSETAREYYLRQTVREQRRDFVRAQSIASTKRQ